MTDRDIILLAEQNLLKRLYKKLDRKDCQTARGIICTEWMITEREEKRIKENAQ